MLTPEQLGLTGADQPLNIFELAAQAEEEPSYCPAISIYYAPTVSNDGPFPILLTSFSLELKEEIYGSFSRDMEFEVQSANSELLRIQLKGSKVRLPPRESLRLGNLQLKLTNLDEPCLIVLEWKFLGWPIQRQVVDAQSLADQGQLEKLRTYLRGPISPDVRRF